MFNTCDIGSVFDNLDDYHLLEAFDLLGDLTHFLERIMRLAVVVVAICCKQYLGFYLAKPIHHSLKAKVRGARGPYGAHTGRCQHGNHRLSDVGHEPCHPVTWLDTTHSQCGSNRGNLYIQLVKGGL